MDSYNRHRYWYEQKECDQSPIISSRVRVARNLAKYPFSAMLDKNMAAIMIGEMTSQFMDDYTLIEPGKVDKLARIAMLERHEISPDLLKFGVEHPSALLKCNKSGASIMLGEEDHIRIQAIAAGNDLDLAYAAADAIDERLGQSLDMAYHKDFGYLTSCPTNTGTGLRASFMMHIPMTEKSGGLPNIIRSLSKLGLTVRGIYGEGSKPCGSIYQISNQVTLGKSETEILSEMKTIGAQLSENEQTLLKSAFTKNPIDMEDIIYRAKGLLGSARKITQNEAMESLSAIRVGLMSGILKKNLYIMPIYGIMINIQPANVQEIAGGHLNERDIGIYRAKYLREIFG